MFHSQHSTQSTGAYHAEKNDRQCSPSFKYDEICPLNSGYTYSVTLFSPSYTSTYSQAHTLYVVATEQLVSSPKTAEKKDDVIPVKQDEKQRTFEKHNACRAKQNPSMIISSISLLPSR